MTDPEFEELLTRLSTLYEKCRPKEPWRIEEEPHDYLVGTDHFNHVRQTAYVNGEIVNVTIGRYLTPELTELLVLMRNNLPEIIERARGGRR